MRVVQDYLIAGNLKLLRLDGELPMSNYTAYLIGGKRYDIVPVYDAPNCIAVKSTENFVGQTVEFV